MSIQLFILATLSSSWLSQACDDEHSIVCLFLWPSLPPGWVRLAMMSIQLFVYSCDPLFLLVELGLRRGAFNCLFILVTLSSSWLRWVCDAEHSIVCSSLWPFLFSFLFCLFLWPFLFCQFELGLQQWTPIVCLFVLITLSHLFVLT